MLAAMNTWKTGVIALLAVAAGFLVGLQTSGRYHTQPSANAAYVLRTDQLTGNVKAVPVDFSAFAGR